MATKLWKIDAYAKYVHDNTLKLASGESIKCALVATGLTPTYSAWVANTAYAVGNIRIPTTRNGRRYICTVAGTSHASVEPTWPKTDNATVSDGTVTWKEYGGEHLDRTVWANISGNEVANGNGYTTGGVALTTIVVDNDKLDFDDILWSALGNPSAVTFREAWFYRVGTYNSLVNPLIGYALIDDTPANVTITNSDYKLQVSASGFITFPHP